MTGSELSRRPPYWNFPASSLPAFDWAVAESLKQHFQFLMIILRKFSVFCHFYNIPFQIKFPKSIELQIIIWDKFVFVVVSSKRNRSILRPELLKCFADGRGWQYFINNWSNQRSLPRSVTNGGHGETITVYDRGPERLWKAKRWVANDKLYYTLTHYFQHWVHSLFW